jgi:hypothetical protein
LEEEAIKYSPDLIVWSYVLNDPAHPVYHNASGELALYYFKPESHLAHFIFSKLFLIAENVKRRAYDCDYEYHKLLHCVYWRQVETNIKNLAKISVKNGIPVVFLIHTVFKENGDYNSYPLSSLHENIVAEALFEHIGSSKYTDGRFEEKD